MITKNIKNLFYLLFPRILRSFSNLLIQIPLAAYYLSYEEIGILALIATLVFFILSIFSLNIVWDLQSKFLILKNKVDQQYSIYIFNVYFLEILFKIFLLVLAVFVYFFLKKILEISISLEITLCFFIYLISGIFSKISEINNLNFILKKKFNLSHNIDLLRVILNVVLAIIFFKFNFGILSIVTSYLISNFICLIIEIYLMHRRIKFKIKKKYLYDILSLSKKTFFPTTVSCSCDLFEKFSINNIFSLREVGIYSNSKIFLNFFLMIYKNTLKNFLSDFITNIKNKSLLNDIEKKLIDFNYLFLYSCIIVNFYSYDLLNILSNGKFIESASYIPFWYLVCIVSIQNFIYSNFLLAKKKIRILLLTEIISSLFLLIFTYVILKFFGIKTFIIFYIFTRLFLNYLRYYSIDKSKLFFGDYQINFFKIFIFCLFLTIILSFQTIVYKIKFLITILIIIFMIVKIKEFLKFFIKT